MTCLGHCARSHMEQVTGPSSALGEVSSSLNLAGDGLHCHEDKTPHQGSHSRGIIPAHDIYSVTSNIRAMENQGLYH